MKYFKSNIERHHRLFTKHQNLVNTFNYLTKPNVYWRQVFLKSLCGLYRNVYNIQQYMYIYRDKSNKMYLDKWINKCNRMCLLKFGFWVIIDLLSFLIIIIIIFNGLFANIKHYYLVKNLLIHLTMYEYMEN